MKLEISNNKKFEEKTHKYIYIYKLNNILLNIYGIKKDIKRELRKYFLDK